MKIAILGFGILLVASAASAQTTMGSQAQNNVNVTALAGGGGGGGSTDVHYSGHEYSTPNVGGSYFAGANNCLVGVGAGASGGPFGFSLNWGRDSAACERRMDAGAFFSMAGATHDPRLIEAALNRMCDGDDNKGALQAAGYVCPIDRPRVVVAAAVAAPPASPAPTPSASAAATRPAYCAAYGRGAVPPDACR